MSTHAPLLPATEKVVTAIEMESNSNATPPKINNNNEQEQLQFYDPTTILNVSREVAFGYLILLTGGEVEYEPPKLEEVSSRSSSTQQQQSRNKSQLSKLPNPNNANESQPQSTIPSSQPSSTPVLNEETASLAYAAIVDGNVLHTCFGLKATANGRANNTINPPKEQSSILCCFPNSTATLDALQLVLPHLTMNKLRMASLVEILREVGDLHLEEQEQGSTATPTGNLSTKVPLYMQVIHGYVHSFTSIVRYHDTKKHFKKKITKEKRNRVIVCCSKIINRLLSRKKSDTPQLEQLQNEMLLDIERGFEGVRERIWEGLERMASDTAFTGFSVEE